jgi:phage internal scaffolding protein
MSKTVPVTEVPKRRRVQVVFTEPSMTKQSLMAECDINRIVERSRASGVVSHLTSKPPMYADVSNVPDYHTALAIVDRANEALASLPAKVRERFGNNAAGLMQFLGDPANRAEAESLGLLQKRDLPLDKGPEAPSAVPAK